MKENKLNVTLEVAKFAKKVGFDDICDWGFCFDKEKEAYYEDYDPQYFQNSKLWEKHFAAPTREQLNEWLRKQNVFVNIALDQTYEPKFAYSVKVYQEGGNWDTFSQSYSDLYYRYEQALEDGLIEGLKKLK